MTHCKWCGITIYWKSLAGGGYSACEDKELTKIHDCPRKPSAGQQAPPTVDTTKKVKVELTDEEKLFVRNFHHFCKELVPK